MIQKVFITGATGFIGSHLVETYLALKKDVTIFTRPGNEKARALETRGVHVVYGDINDTEALTRAMQGIDIVFHVAAVVTDWAPMALFRRVNIEGTRAVCEAAFQNNVRRLVKVSTNDVFEPTEGKEIDESYAYGNWREPYPDTKGEAAKIVWEYDQKGLPCTMVYPCWVYGPGDQTFVPLLADAIQKGEMLFWSKTTCIWPAYVDNLIDLLLMVAEHPKAVGEGFLMHDGESLSFREFNFKIADAINVKPPTIHLPYGLAYALAWMMELAWKCLRIKTRPLLTTYAVRTFGSNLRFSIKKAERLLGWQPTIPFAQGFATTMAWLNQTDARQWKQK